MIRALPAPIRGATHVRVECIEDQVGNDMVTVTGALGSVDGAGGFVPDPLLAPLTLQMRGRRLDRFREGLASKRPASVPRAEFRRGDILAHLDADGWLPRDDGA